MKGDFARSLDRLIEETPTRLTGHVEVNQVYAHYQHEHPEFHHPDGGGAFYLKEPLYVKVGDYLARLGRGAVTKRGGELRKAMIDNMEALSREVYDRAPWEFGDLRASGHPSVEENGHIVYDRPPNVHRLSEEELRIKHHLRYLYDPHRYQR